MQLKIHDAATLRAYPQHAWFLGWLFALLDAWLLLISKGSFTLSIYNRIPMILWYLLLAAAFAYIPFQPMRIRKKRYRNGCIDILSLPLFSLVSYCLTAVLPDSFSSLFSRSMPKAIRKALCHQ